MKNTLYVLLLVLLACQSINAQDFYNKLQSELQTAINAIVQESGIPGMTLAVALDDSHIINIASGFSDKESKLQLQPTSRMLSGSVGKMFVSAIVLKLVEEDKIKLDASASLYLGKNKWFSDLPNAKEITVRSLLNHTSGLPRYIFQPEFLKDIADSPLKNRSPVDCIAYILNKPALHPTGMGWAYSDTNYLLLGLIIEKVTGKPYYNILQKDILSPMELSATEPSTRRKLSGLAQGHIGSQNYFNLPNKVVNDGLLVINPAFEWTGGGVITSSYDLAVFAKKLHEGKYLNKQSKKMLREAVNMANGQSFDQGYGLGSFIWSKSNDTRYGHSGFFPGYLSHVEYSSKRQYSIAIQINTDEGYSQMQQYIYQIDKLISKYLDDWDELKIQRNFDKQAECWNAHDIECYMEAYAESEKIQTASRGGITFGYDNIIGDYKKYFPKDRMGSLHFDNFNYRRLTDDLYFVTGRFNLKLPDREELARGWFSVTAKKINGDWHLITDHSS